MIAARNYLLAQAKMPLNSICVVHRWQFFDFFSCVINHWKYEFCFS